MRDASTSTRRPAKDREGTPTGAAGSTTPGVPVPWAPGSPTPPAGGMGVTEGARVLAREALPAPAPAGGDAPSGRWDAWCSGSSLCRDSVPLRVPLHMPIQKHEPCAQSRATQPTPQYLLRSTHTCCWGYPQCCRTLVRNHKVHTAHTLLPLSKSPQAPSPIQRLRVHECAANTASNPNSKQPGVSQGSVLASWSTGGGCRWCTGHWAGAPRHAGQAGCGAVAPQGPGRRCERVNVTGFHHAHLGIGPCEQ